MAYQTITLNEDEQAQLDSIVTALQNMALTAKHNDIELSHFQADNLLLEALAILRQAPIANAYIEARKAIGFWYS